MVSRKDKEAEGCFWGLLGNVLFCRHFFVGVIWEFACCHLLLNTVVVLVVIFYTHLVSKIFFRISCSVGQKVQFYIQCICDCSAYKNIKNLLIQNDLASSDL